MLDERYMQCEEPTTLSEFQLVELCAETNVAASERAKLHSAGAYLAEE